MYLYGITLAISLFFSIIMLSFGVEHKREVVELSISGYKTSSNTLSNDGVHTTSWASTPDALEAHVEKEMVTKVLLRTCDHLYMKALLNNCATPRDPSLAWGFIGSIGTSGSLLGAWTGSTTNVFTCSSMDAYGRGLIQNVIPVSFILNRGYRYDFTGIQAGIGRAYPCGYSEIITK